MDKRLVTSLKSLLLFVCVYSAFQPGMIMTARGQSGKPETNSVLSGVQHSEEVRAACIEGRRQICGKILKLLPDGLVVESGYTNLLREPLSHSWLLPGTVQAGSAAALIEAHAPGSMCAGIVFVTDYPKSKSPKPKQYDYVIIQGYPAGQYTYTSLGAIQRTVRRFSAVLSKAVALNLREQKP